MSNDTTIKDIEDYEHIIKEFVNINQSYINLSDDLRRIKIDIEYKLVTLNNRLEKIEKILNELCD